MVKHNRIHVSWCYGKFTERPKILLKIDKEMVWGGGGGGDGLS